MGKDERRGNRKSRDSFKGRVPDLGYYIIFTDTDATEENYIKGFYDSLPKEIRDHIVLNVFKAKTKELVNRCAEQAALSPQYREPWIAFDRDKVVDFDGIIRRAEEKGIKAGWSNPCIEVWFEAYFGHMHDYPDSKTCCSRFGESFKSKTGKEYDKSEIQIYELLSKYGDEKRAIEVAEKRMQNHQKGEKKLPSEMCPGTTLHYLIGEIREKQSEN